MRLLLESTQERNPIDTPPSEPMDADHGNLMGFLQKLLQMDIESEASYRMHEARRVTEQQVVSPDVSPDVLPDMSPDVLSDMSPDVSPDVLQGPVTVFLQDVADSDNRASFVAYLEFWTELNGKPTPQNPILFILALRGENLQVPKYDGKTTFPGVKPRCPAEAHCDVADSLLVAVDAARRIIMWLSVYLDVSLEKAAECIRIYNGGRPKLNPNLAHPIHAQDCFFDRKDLVPDGLSEDLGVQVSSDEYRSIVDQVNGKIGVAANARYSIADEDRQLAFARQDRARRAIFSGVRQFADAINVAPENILLPLHTIFRELPEPSNKNDQRVIYMFALGPLTGLRNLCLLDIDEVLRKRLRGLFGQLFAWKNLSPEAKNILPNQFNVDCDTDAVEFVLVEIRTWKKTKVYLVPTEVLKTDEYIAFLQKLHESLCAQQFDDLTSLQRAWRHWNEIKGGKAQCIFDPAVVFLAKSIKDAGYAPNGVNSLMDMLPVEIFVPTDDYNYDRPIYCMRETRGSTNIYAASRVKPEMFDAFCNMTRDLLLCTSAARMSE
jgi:hypothetical protein